jgi:hypothetical protein
MTPFNKIQRGLERARVHQVEWRQVLGAAKEDSPQAAEARAKLTHLDSYIVAETKLLAFLRRRWRFYELFPTVDKPADLLQQHKLWTGPPPQKEALR